MRSIVGFLLTSALALGATGALAAQAIPKLFIASDSTAAKNSSAADLQGWAEPFAGYFDPRKLQVVNVARGGRSSRTFVTEGHWEKMLADVSTGDFVIIQFGHNDSGALNMEPPGSKRPLRARGTIPGIGNESEEIDNVITGKHETVYSFGWYLRKMIADVRAKGATPILLTLTVTNNWTDERIACPSDTYRLWTWQISRNEKASFVDLSRIIADRYQRAGPDAVKAQFGNDTVHTNIVGAEGNAADVVAGLRALRDLPLRNMLSKSGLAVRADRGRRRSSVCPALPPS